MWTTGNWSSRRNDGGVLLLRSGEGWDIYECDEGGSLVLVSEDPLDFAPPTQTGFGLEEAQAWAEANIPLRAIGSTIPLS